MYEKMLFYHFTVESIFEGFHHIYSYEKSKQFVTKFKFALKCSSTTTTEC